MQLLEATVPLFQLPGDLSLWQILLAPFIGSFLGVLVIRAPSPRDILWGRSACPRCGRRLGALELVPLLSWLALRGRCSSCRARIAIFYPLIELAAVGIALWSAWAMSGWLVWATSVLGWCLLALALIDVRLYFLPDFLTLPLMLGGLLVNSQLSETSFVSAAVGAGAGLLFVLALRAGYWRLRRREGIGLGDAKLLAACGAWTGWERLPSVVLIAALFGLLVAFLRYLRLGSVSATDRIAFGACLCGALWLVWVYGSLG